MRVLGISCVTNMAAGILPQPLDHAEVIAAGKEAAPRFTRLLSGILARLEAEPVRAEERLTPAAIEEIREAIADADGNEVFLVGRMGDDGRIASVTVGARGTDGSRAGAEPAPRRG